MILALFLYVLFILGRDVAGPPASAFQHVLREGSKPLHMPPQGSNGYSRNFYIMFQRCTDSHCSLKSKFECY